MTVQTKDKQIVPRKVKYDQDYIKRSRGEKIFTVCNYIFMVLLLIFLLYPVLNVIAISMSSETEVMAANVTFYPIGYNPQAYKTIFRDAELWRSILNSFIVSFGGCALSLIALSVAAYPLAFGKFYGKKLYSVIKKLNGIVVFSPLRDRELPSGVSGSYNTHSGKYPVAGATNGHRILSDVDQ